MKGRLLLAASLAGVLAAACANGAPADPDGAPLAAAPTDSAAASTDRLAPPAHATQAVVSQVIDGDTVVVDFGGSRENVRLIGIDTPEPRGGYQPAECFGDEASDFTRQLLPGGTAILVSRDVEPRDVYDRLLGYLYRAEDGLFVNLALVESGYADTLNIPPNDTFADTFAAASSRARAEQSGLWGACGGPDVLVAD